MSIYFYTNLTIYLSGDTHMSRVTLYGKTVDTELWYKFKGIIAKNFGTERGHLNKELDVALQEYIEKREFDQIG